MGQAEGPTSANNKSLTEISLSSNESVDWAKSFPLGSLSHGMGSLKMQLDLDANKTLMNTMQVSQTWPCSLFSLR